MKFKFLNKELDQLIGKFQEGGEMAAPAPEEAAPAAPELGGDPMELILAAAALALQNQDCLLAMQVMLALIEMAGGGAPAPELAPEGQLPVYKKGGKLSKWISK